MWLFHIQSTTIRIANEKDKGTFYTNNENIKIRMCTRRQNNKCHVDLLNVWAMTRLDPVYKHASRWMGDDSPTAMMDQNGPQPVINIHNRDMILHDFDSLPTVGQPKRVVDCTDALPVETI